MPVDNLQQLFSHELRDMYAGEQELVKALEELEQQDPNQELGQIFSQHLQETQQQVDRLERIFETVGEQPEPEGGQGLGGIVAEHDSFVQMQPSEQVHAAYDAESEKKVERYEITAYQGLIKMGRALGLSEEAMELLQESLSEERRQLDRLENFSHGFDLAQLRQQGG